MYTFPVPVVVIIGPPDTLAALTAHAHASEVYSFSDADALEALDEITRRQPPVVVLDRLFAATSRGAALINRIKADPALDRTEIRIVSPETGRARVSPRLAADPHAEPVPAAAAAATAPALDQRGTRRAPRFRLAKGIEVLIDGNPATLVDLSAVGAQVVSATILRPNQRVRLTLPDPSRPLRFSAVVAWAAFELPKTPPSAQYRAGVAFVDADPAAVTAFAQAVKQS